MDTLDIVSLIENNPITKLSSDYNNKLLVKIKENFTDIEQQLFVSSFYCYLNYDKNKDFIIDLDNVWKWLGFKQKIDLKRLLEKYFVLNIDYINLALGSPKASCSNDIIKNDKINNDIIILNKEKQEEKWGGQNKQTFLLTIKCFKLMCLKAQTKKSNEIHEYYIKMEDFLQQIIEEETDELKVQLKKQNYTLLTLQNSIEENKQKAIEQTLIKQFPLNTECIYFGTINNTNETNDKLIKFGHTNNLHNRILDHRKNYDNFILLESFKVQNKVEIENCIKCHPKIKKQIRTIQINDKNKTEIIAYNNDNFTIENLTKYIKEIIQEKMYNIDNFNNLLKQNDDLLKENDDLKKELVIQKNTITKLGLEIVELTEKIDKQKEVLEIIEKENQTVYQNSLLPEDELTNKFNEFINTMCIVRTDVEESCVNMEGQYRIWSKIKPKKEVFHSLKNYLDTRFKPSRLTSQNKNQVVYGYIGVKLKHIEYKKKMVNDDVETFLFQVCHFSPSGKILNSILLQEYQRWKKSVNKECNDNDMKDIKEYLNSCEYTLKSTVWTNYGSNEGYYGLSLKNDEYNHKTTSSTGKKVEKVEKKTGQVLGTWETIAKAAETEHISAAKMSRSIKNVIVFNNDYYYRTIT
jgi:phage anti-repressor protein